MKKQLLLLAMILLPMAAANIFAEEVNIDGLWYELLSDVKEAKVIQYKNNIKYGGDIVIPETVEYEGSSYSLTSIEGFAFYECSGVTSITIPNSVTSIGSSAFKRTGWYNNQNSGLLYLDNWLLGYKGDKPTGELTIAEGTKGIASSAFSECSGLISIFIPNSVTSIGSDVFRNCSVLSSITIPNSVTR